MLVMIMGLSVSGIMMSQGVKAFEETHEILANTILLVVVVHILGVMLHTIRHKEHITASMVHGRKAVDLTDAISSSRPITAIIFVFIVSIWAWGLVSNYDSQRQLIRLPGFGTELKIGERGDKENRDYSSKHSHDEEHTERHEKAD